MQVFFGLRRTPWKKEAIIILDRKSMDVFEILCRNNYERIYRSVYLYTKDRQISEDALQQAFIIAFNKIDQLREKEKFASWVITIALNEAKHMLIKQSHHKVVPLIDNVHSDIPSITDHIDLKNDTKDLLRKMKGPEAEILILRYYADLTLEEISKALDISLSNAKVRLHRAKASFKQLMTVDSNQSIGGGF